MKGNLAQVQKTLTAHTKTLHFGLLNVRSIGADVRSGQICDFIQSENFAFAALTEMWHSADDKSEQQIGDISGENYSFQHHPRNGQKGRGVGILCTHTLKLLPYTPFISFEHIKLSIATSKAHLHLVVIS